MYDCINRKPIGEGRSDRGCLTIEKVLFTLGVALLVFLCSFLKAYPFSLQKSGLELGYNQYDYWQETTIHYSINTSTIPTGLNVEDVVSAIQQAFEAWATASGSTITFVYDGETTEADAQNDGVNVVYWVASWPPPERPDLANNVIANTRTYVDTTGRLQGADIQFNGQYTSWSTSSGGESGKHDVQSAATHEVGHFIGIDHSDDPSATMYPYIPAAEIQKRTLEQDDIDAVTFLYPSTPVTIAVVSGDDRVGQPGSQLPEPLKVRVTDGGVGVGGAFVIYDNEEGTLGNTEPFLTNGEGYAETTLILPDSNATVAVRVVAAGLAKAWFSQLHAEPATAIASTSGNGQSGKVGEALASPFVVTVKDQYDRDVSGVEISFNVLAGGGGLSNGQPQITNASGQAETTLTLGSEPGTDNNQVEAVNSGLSGSPVIFTATAFQNQAPVLDNLESSALSYIEDDPPTVLTETITVGDPDDATLISATIQITDNYQSGEDVLLFADTGTISGSWAGATGALSLTGEDTLANYQAALRSVTYQNTSENPSILDRTITWTVNDGEADSNSVTRTVALTAVSDPPEVSNIPDQEIAEGTTFATIALDNYVTDLDNADSEIVWTYTGNTDLTVTIDGSRVATITIPDADWNGSETITFKATDPGALFDEDSATFTVTAVNDAPVVSYFPDQ
jgi:hypothetical protein